MGGGGGGLFSACIDSRKELGSLDRMSSRRFIVVRISQCGMSDK